METFKVRREINGHCALARIVLGVSFVMALLLAGAALGAGEIHVNRGIELKDGHPQPGRFGTVVFSDTFDDEAVWTGEKKNYQDLLKIDFAGTFLDAPCLLVSAEALERSDTAWHVASGKIDLTDKAPEFVLTLSVAATSQMVISLEDASCRSSVEWFDAQGKACGEQRFGFIAKPNMFQDVCIYGSVPQDATAFVLHFGFDSPDFEEGTQLALRRVELAMIDPACPQIKPCWFISGIVPGGSFDWDAETPPGTAIKFQVMPVELDNVFASESEADYDSAFHGPDGTSQSFYEQPFENEMPWLRYKAILVPADGKYPVLKRVTAGNVTTSRWSPRSDTFPPRVKIISATPVRDLRAPVTLQVTDDSPVLWNSVGIAIDDSDKTEQFTREQNELHFTPDSDWSEGLHTVSVTVSDAVGNKVDAKKCFFIGDTPTTPRVTLRDDGMTLIDGKPFFPIGIMVLWSGNSIILTLTRPLRTCATPASISLILTPCREPMNSSPLPKSTTSNSGRLRDFPTTASSRRNGTIRRSLPGI
ncbi:MAG: hypothetical protein Q4G68_14690 [Planctomycetia bacterium]|nr:hypothetical protein [Planctomycetia bacterium]